MRTVKVVKPWVALTLFLAIAGYSRAAVVVQSPGATVAGQTIRAWTAAWWQWAAALAPPGDPFTDTTGGFAGTNQSGPVFFLAGSPGGSSSRQFNVPPNTYVLVPLLAAELSQLEVGFNQTAAQVRQAAQQQANQIDSLHATLDGTTIPQATLFTHRQVSPDFNFVAVANNQVGINGVGDSGIAVADGYFLMLGPLTPGIHVLNYGGGASAFGVFVDETDTITVSGPPPIITAQPVDQAVFTGSNAVFSVSATSTNPPLHFQWRFNAVNLSGATNSTLTISNARVANIGAYRVVVTDTVGFTNSVPAQLTLIDRPPSIINQPAGQVILPASNAVFSVIAGGGTPLIYQWRFNQTNIVAATNSTFLITHVQPSQIGNYAVVITNNYGAVTSSIAGLRLLAWSRTYDGPANNYDRINGVTVDGSGNVVVTGSSRNADGNDDLYTAKYAADEGTLLWEKRYDGPAHSDDGGQAVAVDRNGNVIVTGGSSDGISYDFYTAKYAAADGALIWEKRYSAPNNSQDFARAVAVDGSGNVVVTGESNNTNGDYDYYTAKYAAANGTLLWEKRYQGPGSSLPYAVAVDGSGDVVVTGASQNASGNYDCLTTKYASSNGALLWAKRYNGPANDLDAANAIALDGSGNVVVTGSSRNGSGNEDFYTAKYAASNGALLWEKRYDGPAHDNDGGAAVVVDGSGNVVVTGIVRDATSTSDYYTAKYAAANGALIWEKRYNSPTNSYDDAYALAVDGNGNAVVTGVSYDPDFTAYSCTVAYQATNGALLWEYRRYGGFSGFTADLALDVQGNVVVAGVANNDFLTLKIQTALPEIPSYRFTSVAFTNGNLQLQWTPASGLLLQRTTSLAPADWQTIPGSLNTNGIEVPVTNASGFFQLVKP